MEKNKTQHYKPRLIILSDLWGIEKSDWLIHYRLLLKKYFDITEYDSCILGEVNKTVLTKKNLHDQFVRWGINKAVTNLLQLENDFVNVLGFSVGGYIAWKAGLSGLKIKNYFGVSSARLRKEIHKPLGNLELFFGEDDTFIPGSDWFKKIKVKHCILKNEGHELYVKKDNAEFICERIIDSIQRQE